jgi:hypothetical protein
MVNGMGYIDSLNAKVYAFGLPNGGHSAPRPQKPFPPGKPRSRIIRLGSYLGATAIAA